MEYNFDEKIVRRGTYSSKWDGPPRYSKCLGKNVHWNDQTIPMFHADMDFSCSPAIVAAMHRVADHRIYGYTHCMWVPEYYEAIISWYKRRFDTAITVDDIQYADGTLSAVKASIRAFSSPGDGIILMRPVYDSFVGCITGTFRKMIDCPLLLRGGKYEVNWERFEKLCAVPTNKVFILCSPANPIGRIWSPEELQRMASICRRNSVMLISDEVHADLTRHGTRHHTILNAVSDHSNLVLLSGISKSFNVAGLHCSNAIIPDSRVRAIYKKAYGLGKPTPFAIAALMAAYNESEEWLDALNVYLDGSIDFALDFFARRLPWVHVIRPDATYFLWLDFSACGLSHDEIHRRIYETANVMLQEGTEYAGEAGLYFHRMSVTLPRTAVAEALERISMAFNDIAH